LVKEYHNDSFGAMCKISLAPCSPFSVTADSMRKTVEIAKKHNLQIHTHLAETKDEEEFCIERSGKRPFEFMKSLGWISSNAWFAHSIFLNDEEIKDAGRVKIGVSHCPSSNMRLGSGIARIKEMLEAGVNVSVAVDGSASNDSSNMLVEIRNAMLISRLREPEFWLNTEEVLWMATIGGAKALGRDDIGQIKVGKCADLNLINMDKLEYSGALHDPAAAIVFNVAMNPVDHVIVNGKLIVENGQIADLNELQLVKRHQKISADLVDVAEKRLTQRLKR